MIPVTVKIEVTYTKYLNLEFDGDEHYKDEDLQEFIDDKIDEAFVDIPAEVGDYEFSEWDWREI